MIYLVNLTNINDVKSILSSINLDKTNYVFDILIDKIEEEIEVAIELAEKEYLSYLREIVSLLKESKIDNKNDEISVLENENIIIFSNSFIKSLRKLNDSLYYSECLSTIELLQNKQWMEGNKFNAEKYKRLHGDAYGLSEVKTKYVRLMHMPLNSEFWFVSDVLKKEGNNTKQHRLYLNSLAATTKSEIDELRSKFTINGQLDYQSLIEYARLSNEIVFEELSRFGGRKR